MLGTGAAALLRITWDEAWGIKERAVRRGLERRTAEPIPHPGVDEKAITKGHRYLTIVADLDRHRVLSLHDDRTAESLDVFWPTCTPAQLDCIEAVAMDMWDPYVQSVRTHVPLVGIQAERVRRHRANWSCTARNSRATTAICVLIAILLGAPALVEAPERPKKTVPRSIRSRHAGLPKPHARSPASACPTAVSGGPDSARRRRVLSFSCRH